MIPLLITEVLGRATTTSKCFDELLSHTDRKAFEWVIVDQASNMECKKVIARYEPDHLLVRNFNSGIPFGLNETMVKYRKPGQPIISMDDDVFIETDGWLDLYTKIIECPTIGTCSGRRPTLFFDNDMPGRWESYLTLPKTTIDDIWVEIAISGIIGCWWMIKGEVLDKIGYFNEATQNSEGDFWRRTQLMGYKSAYIPDAVCKQPDGGLPTNHPTSGLLKKLVSQQQMLQTMYLSMYAQNYAQNEGILYLGTIFDPSTIKSKSYEKESKKMYKIYEEYNYD